MDINAVWNKIKEHEGEEFYTKRGKPYKYIVYGDFLMVENIKGSRITKCSVGKAFRIENPTPSKIATEGCWGNPYIYGIITDKRIKGY